MLDRDPGVDVVVIVGDITHLGDYAEAEAVIDPLLESGARIIGVGGNMDREGARRCLGDKGIDIHARGVILDGVGFMGLGGGTPSPFRTPWELPPEEATRCLEAGLTQIARARYKVLVSHAPPHATEIDRSFTRMHVGSVPVREFLLRGSVNLCVCGHIHEAMGEDTLDGARCVNIGPYKNGHYALIAIEGDRAEIEWRTR